MRAAVIHPPHDLRIEEVDTPSVAPGQVKLRVRNGGICGSDLHYFHHGGFGSVRVRAPMILGHEVAGEVIERGAGVIGLAVGTPVAVNPSLPCNACSFCLEGMQQHCLDMRFYGSAMRTPHVHGGFREILVCEAAQAVPAPMPSERAAFAEPLSVCLHAVGQAGALLGRRVLVTGAGPIGALCVMVARHAGAREIIATDLMDEPLAVARRVGADRTVNVGTHDLSSYAANKGYFDVAFECSGSGAAMAAILPVVRPRGIIVQVGVAGAEVPVALNTVVAKELTLRGTFRFHAEFALAVQLLAGGALDVAPLLTEVVALDDAARAFALATDRRRAMKVQIGF